MTASLEARALALALLTAAISLGGMLALAVPIRWFRDAPSVRAEAVSSERPVDFTTTPELVAQGRQLFTISCVECHGDDAHGDEGPDLHNLAISNARIAATIRKGVRGEMPTFSRKYDDAQVTALVAYLRSLH